MRYVRYVPVFARGLPSPFVFYLGHLTGDVVAAGRAADFVVDASDLAAVRRRAAAARAMTSSLVSIDEPCDVNRDGAVYQADVQVVRANLGRRLPAFTAPAAATLTGVFADASPAVGTPRRIAPMRRVADAVLLP